MSKVFYTNIFLVTPTSCKYERVREIITNLYVQNYDRNLSDLWFIMQSDTKYRSIEFISKPTVIIAVFKRINMISKYHITCLIMPIDFYTKIFFHNFNFSSDIPPCRVLCFNAIILTIFTIPELDETLFLASKHSRDIFDIHTRISRFLK